MFVAVAAVFSLIRSPLEGGVAVGHPIVRSGTPRHTFVHVMAEARNDGYPSATHPDREVVLGLTDAGRRLKVVRLRAVPTRIVTIADRDVEE